MIEQVSADLSEYRLQKAKDLLIQAKLLHNNKKYDGSINRSYYAIFNGIRSLLALVKLDSSKHSGVIGYFDRYFVKTNIFDTKYSKIIHSAFDCRQDNDYEDFYSPTEDESLEQLNDSEEFINEVDSKIKQFIRNEIQLPAIDI